MLLSATVAVAQSNPAWSATQPPENASVQAIRTAPDPSATIDAYTRAIAAERANSVELEQAYVNRMIELGAPELADAQAHDLINRGVADATIAGMAAYTDATRGNAHGAIQNLKLAMTQRPRDPFLLCTAGQVVAWNDMQAGQQQQRSSLSQEDAAGVDWLRAAGGRSQEFAESYVQAMQVRRQQLALAAQAAPVMPQQTVPAQTTAAQATSTVDSSQTQQRSTTEERSSDGSTSERSTTYSYYYHPSSTSGADYSYPYSSYGYSSGYPYSYSGYSGYNPYGTYNFNGSGNSIIALRDANFYRGLAQLDQRGSSPERMTGGGGWPKGPGGDWRNAVPQPANVSNFPGRGTPGPAIPPGTPSPSAITGRPPQAPSGPPQGSPPRPQQPLPPPQGPRPPIAPTAPRFPGPPPGLPPGPPHP
jgi:hypothetical protein